MPIIPLSLPFHNIIIYYYYYYYYSIEQQVEFVASTYFLSLAIFEQGLCQSHFGLAIFTLKKSLEAKEELWKFKNISPHTKKKKIFRKTLYKKPKSFKIFITLL